MYRRGWPLLKKSGALAHPVERFHGMEEVSSSSLLCSTKNSQPIGLAVLVRCQVYEFRVIDELVWRLSFRLCHILYMERRQHGFTLVELLIVIVVIAILASVSVVAYNSVQKRSKTALIYANATQLAKVVSIYGHEHGNFPGGIVSSCFGDAADFPATSLNNEGWCWNIRQGGDVWDQARVRSPSVSNTLSSVSSNTAVAYDLVELSDTDNYRHAVKGFWYKGSSTAPYTQASINFAVPSDECPGSSVEYVEDYYTNGNICSIELNL